MHPKTFGNMTHPILVREQMSLETKTPHKKLVQARSPAAADNTCCTGVL